MLLFLVILLDHTCLWNGLTTLFKPHSSFFQREQKAAGTSTSSSGLHLRKQLLCSLIPPSYPPTVATTGTSAQCVSYSLQLHCHLWICPLLPKYGKFLQLMNKNKQLAAFPQVHLGKRWLKSTSLYEYDGPNTHHKFPHAHHWSHIRYTLLTQEQVNSLLQ